MDAEAMRERSTAVRRAFCMFCFCSRLVKDEKKGHHIGDPSFEYVFVGQIAFTASRSDCGFECTYLRVVRSLL